MPVWYEGVKENILFKSNNICTQSGEKSTQTREAGRVMSSSHVLTSLNGATVDVRRCDLSWPLLSSKSFIIASACLLVTSVLHLMAYFFQTSLRWLYLNTWYHWHRFGQLHTDAHVRGEVRLDVPFNVLFVKRKKKVFPKSPVSWLSRVECLCFIFHGGASASVFPLRTSSELWHSWQCLNTQTQHVCDSGEVRWRGCVCF